MTFEEKLCEFANEIDVPDELNPENIAAMLKAKTTQSLSPKAAEINIKAADGFSAQRRTIIMRTAAAIAACAVFAAGMISYSNQSSNGMEIEKQIDYSAVSPNSYDDLYNIYTGIYLDGNKKQTPTVNCRTAYSDITVCSGGYIYCASNGQINIVSLKDMKAVSTIDLNGNCPVEIYVDNDKLTVISEETVDIKSVNSPDVLADINQAVSDVPAEDAANSQTDGTSLNSTPDKIQKTSADGSTASSRTNVVVDLYDISDKANPVHSTVYKQNGSYTSSKSTGGVLYIVSGYSDYRVTPLAKDAELDTFVPAYYLNGKKTYVAASNITVPSMTNSTDYTVVSAVCFDGKATSADVKAVLGCNSNVCSSDNAIYIAGSGKNADGDEYSTISEFTLSSDAISYRASGSVAGKIIENGMNVFNGSLRTAAMVTDNNGISSVSVYVLDDTLTLINSAGSLLSGQEVNSVNFEGNYANLYYGKNTLTIDLSSDPPSQVEAEKAFSSVLNAYSENQAFNVDYNDDGSLKLTMFDTVSGGKLSVIDFAAAGALADKDNIYVNSDKSLIGIPVSSHNAFGVLNEYYVFSYDQENGLAEKGVISYNDLDDSCNFKDAVIEDNILYISGGNRVVSVRLDDMKVENLFMF